MDISKSSHKQKCNMHLVYSNKVRFYDDNVIAIDDIYPGDILMMEYVYADKDRQVIEKLILNDGNLFDILEPKNFEYNITLERSILKREARDKLDESAYKYYKYDIVGANIAKFKHSCNANAELCFCIHYDYE